MMSLFLVLWTLATIAIVNRFPIFFQRIMKYRIDFDEDDIDDGMVGHASFSDVEDEEDEDGEIEDSDEDSTFDPDENVPEDLRDFYEESNFSDEWRALTDDEKLKILDKEIDDYMSQKKTN